MKAVHNEDISQIQEFRAHKNNLRPRSHRCDLIPIDLRGYPLFIGDFYHTRRRAHERQN